MWAKPDEERLRAETAATIEEAVQQYLATPPQPPEAMFDFTYAVLPKDLADQRRAALGPGEE
ncbi:MAG: hypothetical protein ACREFK_18050, partial [Stellaceae bacterium]